MKVWVLAGQSNMEGCGCLLECAPSHRRVMSFTSSGRWEQASEPLHKLWESYTPVHQAILRDWNPEATKGKTDEELAKEAENTRTHGAGLGLPFGTRMAEMLDEDIGLIPCAHGGTSLQQWSPSLAPEYGTKSLYGAMLDRIARAGGDLRGVLWYQGESDCNDACSNIYADQFENWVNAVRRDTGHLDLPIVAVQLGCFVPCPSPAEADALYWDRVRDAFCEVEAKLSGVAVIGAIDLPLTDLIHISTPGLKRLGGRAALAMLKMMKGEFPQGGPRIVSAKPTVLRYISAWSGHCGIVLKCEGVKDGLYPKEHMSGFGIYDKSGRPHEKFCIIGARAHDNDPDCIELLVNTPVDNSAYVGYGRGLAPYCNVVDGDDQALLTSLCRIDI